MKTKHLDDPRNVTLEEPDLDRIANRTGPVERPLEPTLDAWISILRARGITFTLTHNRLRVSPWRKLSTDDQATLRQHREAIKQLVRAGSPVAASVDKSIDPAPDLDARLKERDLESWRVIHYNDPAEVERRRVESTSLMPRVRRPAFPNL
jgi:hypothetical protein